MSHEGIRGLNFVTLGALKRTSWVYLVQMTLDLWHFRTLEMSIELRSLVIEWAADLAVHFLSMARCQILSVLGSSTGFVMSCLKG